ncbi:MAG: tagaturonate epimerase family protein [Halanaerobium sp.]
MSWKDFAEELVGTSKEAVKKIAEYAEDYRIYPRSIIKNKNSFYFMAKIDQKNKLVILNKSKNFELFQGRVETLAGFKAKIAPLSHYNAEILRDIFPFTAPETVGVKKSSIGLGDRLGAATPGHIEAVKESNAFPVFAQQSVQELNLTGRTFKSVLDDVSWAVFQEGYQNGFAADADGLKEKPDIKEALDLGYSMITLDCSDYINDDFKERSETEIENAYQEVPEYLREGLEDQYLNKVFILNSGYQLEYNHNNFKEIVLSYYQALDFVKEIKHLLKKSDKDIDLEISIAQSSIPTTPEAHFFVANELKRNKVQLNLLAPAFAGEFQKGIDYQGDLNKFEAVFKVHADIADRFGHKLSIHSGSDKFKLFPIIKRHTEGRVHVKTSGTNWLEAIRVVAENDPSLYRDIHAYAKEKFEAAKEYYQVETDLSQLPELAQMSDQKLAELLEDDNVRQLLHITYGFILQDKKDGHYIFRDKLYKFLDEHDKEYRQALKKHTAHHLNKLGFYKN